MISVIIPVYNAEKYLKQCMDSICGQTYRDLEIIAVDDESKDRSLNILNDYKAADPRVRVISQKNAGVSAARNTGLDASTGEYVLFVDSDDWIDPDTCEKALSAIENDRSDVVVWGYICEFGNDITAKKYPLGTDPLHLTGQNASRFYRRLVGPIGSEMREPQKVDNSATVWGKLYKRNCLGNRRFDTGFSAQEDILFNFYVFEQISAISYLPELLYHYRKDTSVSLTTGFSPEIIRNFTRLTGMMRQRLTALQVPDEFFRALDNRICCMIIGLGIRLIGDKRLPRKEQRKKLKQILAMDFFHVPMQELDTSVFPIHWRIFFREAAKQNTIMVYLLFRAMLRLIRHQSS